MKENFKLESQDKISILMKLKSYFCSEDYLWTVY